MRETDVYTENYNIKKKLKEKRVLCGTHNNMDILYVAKYRTQQWILVNTGVEGVEFHDQPNDY